MKTADGYIFIGSIFVMIILIINTKQKIGLVIRFLLRGILYTGMMLLVNHGLFLLEIGLQVGLNPATILTSAILGFPGVCLLYGLSFW